MGARVIEVTGRLGPWASLAALALWTSSPARSALALAFVAWRALRTRRRATRVAGAVLGAVLVTQLMLGPAMVLARLPLPLATAHNAVAALMLLATVALLRTVTPPAARDSRR